MEVPVFGASPGRFFLLNSTPPAPGSDFSIVVPGRHIYVIHQVMASFTTDVNVANRTMVFNLLAAALTFNSTPALAIQAASSSRNYFCSGFGEHYTDIVGSEHLELPPVHLNPGDSIISNIINLQAGDAFSLIRLYIEEWLIGS